MRDTVKTPSEMTHSEMLAIMFRLGLKPTGRRTAILLGLSQRQLQRIYALHSPIPAPIQRLLSLYDEVLIGESEDSKQSGLRGHRINGSPARSRRMPNGGPQRKPTSNVVSAAVLPPSPRSHLPVGQRLLRAPPVSAMILTSRFVSQRTPANRTIAWAPARNVPAYTINSPHQHRTRVRRAEPSRDHAAARSK